MSNVLSVLRGVLDLLAPRACAGCDLPLAAQEEDFCGGCGPLLEGVGREDAAAVYGGPLADGIRRLKFERRTDLAGPLGRLLAGAAAAEAGRVDVVVPVPLHRSRLAERGFNQAALLARPVARALSVPLHPARLRRLRATRPQSELARPARADNVRGAFVARADPRRPRVLLVDDVRTTGATLAEAAQALRRAGATTVRPLVLAAAERDGGQ